MQSLIVPGAERDVGGDPEGDTLRGLLCDSGEETTGVPREEGHSPLQRLLLQHPHRGAATCERSRGGWCGLSATDRPFVTLAAAAAILVTPASAALGSQAHDHPVSIMIRNHSENYQILFTSSYSARNKFGACKLLNSVAKLITANTCYRQTVPAKTFTAGLPRRDFRRCLRVVQGWCKRKKARRQERIPWLCNIIRRVGRMAASQPASAAFASVLEHTRISWFAESSTSTERSKVRIVSRRRDDPCPEVSDPRAWAELPEGYLWRLPEEVDEELMRPLSCRRRRALPLVQAGP
eukprot:gene18057-biopygen2589